MLAILQNLEPRYEKRGSIIFNELAEVSEILFISKGNIDIGYSINRQKKYVLRFTDKVVIGAFNACFNTRTLFIFKCQSACEGYFIRKHNWVNLLSEDPAIETFIKKNVKNEYIKKIK